MLRPPVALRTRAALKRKPRVAASPKALGRHARRRDEAHGERAPAAARKAVRTKVRKGLAAARTRARHFDEALSPPGRGLRYNFKLSRP